MLNRACAVEVAVGSPGDQEHLGVWTTERRFSASDMRTDLAVLAPGASLVFAAWAHVVDFCGLVDDPTVAKRAELVQKLAAFSAGSTLDDQEAASAYPRVPCEASHPLVPCPEASKKLSRALFSPPPEPAAAAEQSEAAFSGICPSARDPLRPAGEMSPVKPISRRGVSRVATPGPADFPSASSGNLPGAPHTSLSPRAFGPHVQRLGAAAAEAPNTNAASMEVEGEAPSGAVEARAAYAMNRTMSAEIPDATAHPLRPLEPPQGVAPTGGGGPHSSSSDSPFDVANVDSALANSPAPAHPNLVAANAAKRKAFFASTTEPSDAPPEGGYAKRLRPRRA